MPYSTFFSFLLAVVLAGPVHAPVSSSATSNDSPDGTAVALTDSVKRTLTAEERRVASAIEALFAAAERNDMAALDSIYAGTDLTVVESTGMNRGWADYRDHHLAPEMKEMKNFRYRPFEIEPHVSGDLAWAIFRYNLGAETGGRVIDNIGRGTAVLEKRRGWWVVRHTHTASRARRPTDPPASY